MATLAEDQVQRHVEICDKARHRLAGFVDSTEDMRELGLMLGLFASDPTGASSDSVQTSSPFDTHLLGHAPTR